MSFSLEVKDFADKTGKNVLDLTREIAIDLFTGISRQTPVDTGRLKRNWNASLNSPDLSTTTSVDPAGEASISNMKGVVKKAKEGDSIFYSNNLVYAPIIEYGLYPITESPRTSGGFSRQAPNGMVRINIARVNEIMRKAIAGIPK